METITEDEYRLSKGKIVMIIGILVFLFGVSWFILNVIPSGFGYFHAIFWPDYPNLDDIIMSLALIAVGMAVVFLGRRIEK